MHRGKFIPIHFAKQILPDIFEYILSHLIDHELVLSSFDNRFNNDDTGAPAYDPKILLKILLFAYSRGIVSSRKVIKLRADSGFHAETNMKMLFEPEIDAYVDDNQFSQPDPGVTDYGLYKERHRKERAGRGQRGKSFFHQADFKRPN